MQTRAILGINTEFDCRILSYVEVPHHKIKQLIFDKMQKRN